MSIEKIEEDGGEEKEEKEREEGKREWKGTRPMTILLGRDKTDDHAAR